MPLFMLCVPTNSGYVVAATFLTTDEEARSIEGGLRAIARWCPEWQPTCVMSDFSYAQISAFETVFPGTLFMLLVDYSSCA